LQEEKVGVFCFFSRGLAVTVLGFGVWSAGEGISRG